MIVPPSSWAAGFEAELSWRRRVGRAAGQRLEPHGLLSQQQLGSCHAILKLCLTEAGRSGPRSHRRRRRRSPCVCQDRCICRHVNAQAADLDRVGWLFNAVGYGLMLVSRHWLRQGQPGESRCAVLSSLGRRRSSGRHAAFGMMALHWGCHRERLLLASTAGPRWAASLRCRPGAGGGHAAAVCSAACRAHRASSLGPCLLRGVAGAAGAAGCAAPAVERALVRYGRRSGCGSACHRLRTHHPQSPLGSRRRCALLARHAWRAHVCAAPTRAARSLLAAVNSNVNVMQVFKEGGSPLFLLAMLAVNNALVGSL